MRTRILALSVFFVAACGAKQSQTSLAGSHAPGSALGPFSTGDRILCTDDISQTALTAKITDAGAKKGYVRVESSSGNRFYAASEVLLKLNDDYELVFSMKRKGKTVEELRIEQDIVGNHFGYGSYEDSGESNGVNCKMLGK